MNCHFEAILEYFSSQDVYSKRKRNTLKTENTTLQSLIKGTISSIAKRDTMTQICVVVTGYYADLPPWQYM